MHKELFEEIKTGLSGLSAVRDVGRVVTVDGLSAWISGLERQTSIGDRLRVFRRDGGHTEGEVIRIRDQLVAMLPDTGLGGLSLDDRVAVLGPQPLHPSRNWIGRVLDPFGRPIDGKPLLPGKHAVPLRASPPAASERDPLGERLTTGLHAFDTVLPIVRGQRIGLFAGSGVGKSRLLGDLAQNMQSDVTVLALVGERGRELREFVEKSLGPKGMQRSIVVAATSDRSPLDRRRCLHAAMSVAERFRDEGQHVLFLADSVTRFAEAHREVAIAAGEIPALRGFPASVTHEIMSLCERAGPGASGTGDITAIFSVLVSGSDMDEPISDILRGVLDGHVVLDRGIAERGRFPAIDLTRSVSRSLPEAASLEENSLISQVRLLIGSYERSENMVRAGMYRKGSDPVLDQAISAFPEIDSFLAGHTHGGAKDAFDRLRIILRRSSTISGPMNSQAAG